MRQERMEHKFVEFIPDRLDAGCLFISIPYATVVHLCCCGCGEKVVTPLKPTDWSLVFDGETVSLDPSIGNWNYECESHYWIEHGRVVWARKWSRNEIERGRQKDRARKVHGRDTEFDPSITPPTDSDRGRQNVLRRVILRIRGAS